MSSPMRTEEEWRRWLVQRAHGYTSCHDEADDLVQDTLLAYWQRFGCLPWERELDEAEYRQALGWCCHKLRSLAIDARKRACKRQEIMILDDVTGGEWLAVVNDEEALVERIALDEFLATLPAYLRQVAELYEAGYSYGEIAERLGVSVGTVQGYLGRIGALGRAFFGIAGNKRASCVVNNSGCPEAGISNQLEEEERNDETADAVDDGSERISDSAVDDCTEPGDGSRE